MNMVTISLFALLISLASGCGRDEQKVSSDSALNANEEPAELSFANVASAIPPMKQYGNYGALWGDFNNDGRVDLIFMGHGMGPKLQFQGQNNNRLGIGNKIWITSKGNLVAFREYTGTTGSLRSSGCNELHIGLAQNSKVDIRVQWLNGHVSLLQDVNANQVLTISDFQSG